MEIPDYDYYIDKTKYSNKGPFIELQCIREFDYISDLTLSSLRKQGVKGNIQSAMRIPKSLNNHLNNAVHQQNSIDRIAGSNTQYLGPYLNRSTESPSNIVDVHSISDEALKQFVNGNVQQNSTHKVVLTKQYARNPYIAEYAKRLANGKCQLCGCNAPFVDNDGIPYLESHHVEWLSKGGRDSIDNVVALCPNCHRKMHVVNDTNDVIKLKKQ